MNYKQYHKNQNENIVNPISIISFFLFPSLALISCNSKFFLGIPTIYQNSINTILLVGILLSIINISMELAGDPPIRFFKKKRVTYLPVSKVINLERFNATHFLENCFRYNLTLENDKFEDIPLLEKVIIKNKPYVIYTETIVLGDDSKRQRDYLLIDKNDNFITEIPENFKYNNPESKTFEYYIKNTKRGVVPIIKNID